ncbi:hypothetical protein LZK73_15270 [Neorhizobium galegae]|nr:hypothetical protein LZK73_15270 [Neorhizobium galegae]
MPHEVKRDLVREIVNGWLQFCTFSLSLVPQIAKDKTVTINGVVYRLNFQSDEPIGETARRISLAMPLAVAQLAIGSMGSEKLRRQLEDGIGLDGVGASEQLMRAILLADLGIPGISTILRNTSLMTKKSRYLSKVLARKLYDVAIRFRLEAGELNAIRNLAADLTTNIEGLPSQANERRRSDVINRLRKQRLMLEGIDGWSAQVDRRLHTSKGPVLPHRHRRSHRTRYKPL